MEMTPDFSYALSVGTERVAAWADLLDSINVFPVADGDTGRNLVISLAPLNKSDRRSAELIDLLLMSARGNSGNIASLFFCGFLQSDFVGTFPEAIQQGRESAWNAVPNPKQGTMLSLFEALDEAVAANYKPDDWHWIEPVLERLELAVHDTFEQLPELQQAGVVDAGALGMFIFFDGFLNMLNGGQSNFRPIAEVFKERLSISDTWQAQAMEGSCIDAVLHVSEDAEQNVEDLNELGNSIVAMRHGDYYKIHMHSKDSIHVKEKLSGMGDMLRWSSDDLKDQTEKFPGTKSKAAIHIMTDAAGSFSRSEAIELDVTLLDSYISVGEICMPETYVQPLDMYGEMTKGTKVSTSQASVFERHQHYEKVLSLYDKVLYLCVGSVFTGNFQVVSDWKKEHDPDNKMTVIDTGAASGRLGLMSYVTAQFARQAQSAQEVIDFARAAVESCEEYIFLDKLQYLAAGGRLSKTGAFFGDMLHVKPVVTPLADGVKKVATVRNQADQIKLALEMLNRSLDPASPGVIMLEFSDNEEWVKTEVYDKIAQRYPDTRIVFHPISLTSGAHMGPGTWAVAFVQLSQKLQ